MPIKIRRIYSTVLSVSLFTSTFFVATVGTQLPGRPDDRPSESNGTATKTNFKLKLCNRTNTPIIFAIVYEKRKTLVTDGWFTIHPGCNTLDFDDVTSNTIYTYAHNSTGNWGGNSQQCVPSQAGIYKLVYNCERKIGMFEEKVKLGQIITINYNS